MVTGEMILATLKGPCHCGASLMVPYGNGRFFPSRHTNCLTFHVDASTSILYATLLRAWMANSQFCWMFVRYSSAVRLLDSVCCCMESGGSHPINSSFGVKPVVEFQLLL
jgi:hypothetical protein